jgi:hypothetical protein
MTKLGCSLFLSFLFIFIIFVNYFMSNLNDLINLAKADGGKFFVIDESGDAKLVIMSVEDYQHLLLGKLQRQVLDVESINKEILRAQMEDVPVSSANSKPQAKGPSVVNEPAIFESPSSVHHQPVDLRAEVIDPSFDFEGPRVEIDDL